jgi:Cu+-exporting ATPase
MAIDTSNPPATSARSELAIEGMSCANCVRHVTEALQGVPGVKSAVVSLEGRKASVRWAPASEENLPTLIDAVQKAGYQAKPLGAQDATAGTHEHPRAGLWGSTVLTGIIPTALLMAGEWIFRLGEVTWYRWASFVLAGIVQFGPGRHFYRGAWNQLKIGSSNMDTLVALGSSTAFAYSAWVLLSGRAGHLYFMEAAAIITLISVGH